MLRQQTPIATDMNFEDNTGIWMRNRMWKSHRKRKFDIEIVTHDCLDLSVNPKYKKIKSLRVETMVNKTTHKEPFTGDFFIGKTSKFGSCVN